MKLKTMAAVSLCLSILLLSCGPQHNSPKKINYEVKHINIQLDSSQVVSSSTAITTSADKKHLFIFDHFFFKIYQYKTNNFELEQIIQINKDSIKEKVMSVQEISPDVFGLYVYKTHSLLYYSTKTNKIIKTVNFTPSSNELAQRKNFAPSLPYVNATCPLIIKDNEVVGTGYYMGELFSEVPNNRTVCSIFDLNTSQKKYAIPYPKTYWIDNWGGVYYRNVYSCYNRKRNSLILSFPAEADLHEVNNKYELRTISCKTNLSPKIKPLAISKKDIKMGDGDYIYKHFATNASYGPIIFDEHNNFYYRVLEQPISKIDLQKNALIEKKCILIAYDHNFVCQGFCELPIGLSYSNFFLINGSIYFLNLLNNDEDVANFTKIKIQLV